MACRGFISTAGRGDALKKHFAQKEQVSQNQEPLTTSDSVPGGSRPLGRRQLFQSPDEQSSSSPFSTSRPIGRGQLFAPSETPVPNEVSASRHSLQKGVPGSSHAEQNGGVPTNTPLAPSGVGRAVFLQKFQSYTGRSQPSQTSNHENIPHTDELKSSIRSSSTRQLPPDSGSPDAILSNLSLSDSSSSSAPLEFRGDSGYPCEVVTNYIRLDFEPGRGIYQYDVRFTPEVDSKQMRIRLLRQLRDVIQLTSNFDGAILYLPFKLPDNVTEVKTLMQDSTPIMVKITLVKHMRMGDRLCVHLYNVLFRRIMNILGYVEHGRNFYDPNTAKPIPAHKLSVWPGVITSIQEYEDGVMLLCDASHRVLREQTVLQLMEDIIDRCEGRTEIWQKEFREMVSGQIVLTRYNNKIYKIDDVDYSRNPRHSFMRGGHQITYVDYYHQQYAGEAELTDLDQPLLLSRVKCKVVGETVESFVDLVPELCHLSGITDVMRNDFKVMKSIDLCTRISPSERQLLLQKFLTTLHGNAQARKVLEDWGLRLSSRNITVEGRILQPEAIIAGNHAKTCEHNCNWTKHITNSGVISAIHLNSWSVICTRHDERNVRDLVSMYHNVGRKLGIDLREPEYKILPNDNIGLYVNELRRLSGKQIVVVVLPLARNDKYNAVKTVCCLDNPIPSQVIISRTIRQKEKLRSVATKILMQMNVKLGGTLWAVQMPLKGIMVIGLDTYHDSSRRSNSVGAVVASLNPELTRWYSRIYRQDVGQELVDGFEIAVTQCLKRNQQLTGVLPAKLIIYRDGLSDSQLETCSMYEMNQLQRACMRHAPDYNPEVLFVVVQKRIHTRMFLKRGKEMINAPPGTILDHTVTRRDKHDFFLVSQNVTQGTVTPSHYIILNNTTNLTPDKIQRLTYKLTHLYYNWTGTIRVPAPCQYAHKLASLVGANLDGREADDSLRDKLFYL